MTEAIHQIALQYLKKVRRSGNEDVMAICPFHRKADGSEEKGPSFAMNIYSGLWYCHSCHSRGNLYTFLRDVGLSRTEIDFHYKRTIEAAEQYAPPRPNPVNPIDAVAEPLDESFLGLFDYCPQEMLDQGYPEDLLRRFDVGFDHKHNRITFPLRDMKGKLIGISGRALEPKAKPRYKVYEKEYSAFGLAPRTTDKRALLWNGHSLLTLFEFSKDPGQHFVVVVEGFKAALRVAQGGIPNVVALMGSDMSQEQQWLLENMGVPILFMLDNNDAGRRGQLRACKTLVRKVPRLYVVNYNAAQPSDMIASDIILPILSAESFTKWFIEHSNDIENIL